MPTAAPIGLPISEACFQILDQRGYTRDDGFAYPSTIPDDHHYVVDTSWFPEAFTLVFRRGAVTVCLVSRGIETTIWVESNLRLAGVDFRLVNTKGAALGTFIPIPADEVLPTLLDDLES